jgi:hypothetical protein
MGIGVGVTLAACCLLHKRIWIKLMREGKRDMDKGGRGDAACCWRCRTCS